MQITLLTHAREVFKKTNTGQLVQQIVPNTQTIIWQRTEPDAALLQQLKLNNTALLYFVDEAESTENIEDYENFILIDSTWQEARKIFNRSPYLQTLPKIKLSFKQNSKYHLRRNQVEGGLCTAECVIELLRVKKCFDAANELQESFERFITQPVIVESQIFKLHLNNKLSNI